MTRRVLVYALLVLGAAGMALPFVWMIVTALKSHQRYFSVAGERGQLLPSFVAFADGALRQRRVARPEHLDLVPETGDERGEEG